MRLVAIAVVVLLAAACGNSDKVDKLERQVADLEDELAETRKERKRAERKAEALEVDRSLDDAKREASKAYDRQDLDRARDLAVAVLVRAPNDTQMLRIVVSASCVLHEQPIAQKYYALLPRGGRDREHMKTRCEHQGVALSD